MKSSGLPEPALEAAGKLRGAIDHHPQRIVIFAKI
jgi:hypothetical protein